MLLLLYCDVYVACIDRSYHNITTQKQEQQNRVGTIYIYYLSTLGLVPLLYLCWLYSLIIFHIIFLICNYYSWILFIYRISNNITRHQQQQQQRKGMIDMMFVLHCFPFFVFKYVYITDKLFLKNYYFHLLWRHKFSFLSIFITRVL